MESEKPDKDLIVDVTSTEVHIALMENHRLIEYNTESSTGNKFSVGDVYLGKVKKILPNLNAAFVDIGDKKEAFIHYLDLGLYFHAFDQFVRESNQNTNLTDLYARIEVGKPLPKEGKIEEILKPGQMIVSQIVKEPISTKGSRLTAEISLAGRNIVLLPFTEKVSISQKIASKEEKRRLETLVKSILPKNYGAIIRTAAEGKNAATLVGETKALIEKWESSWKKIARNKNVQLLFTEYSKTTTVLRDLLNDSFSNIWINDEKICDEARKYISLISPEQEKIVHLYEGKQPIYDHFEVTRQIKSSFGKVVPMRQGAYLVIETTEALNVIDVNSGIRTKTADQEENSFEVNKLAAEEIARQLRLRDMGGIVIVDFIDMESNDHKNALAADEVRADADHPPADPPGDGNQHHGAMPAVPRHRQDPLHRGDRRGNRTQDRLLRHRERPQGPDPENQSDPGRLPAEGLAQLLPEQVAEALQSQVGPRGSHRLHLLPEQVAEALQSQVGPRGSHRLHCPAERIVQ